MICKVLDWNPQLELAEVIRAADIRGDASDEARTFLVGTDVSLEIGNAYSVTLKSGFTRHGDYYRGYIPEGAKDYQW